MKNLNIAIVGITGLVGQTFLKVLKERKIQINKLYLYASEKSKDKEIIYNDKKYKIQVLCEENIKGKDIDYALFSAGEKVSKYFAKFFVDIGAIVIDNSSAYRMDNHVPLIVPEVNGPDIYLHDGIIANPNCSTIQCMSPLKILDNKYFLESVNFTTFQSVSGSGIKGLEDLEKSADGLAAEFYPYPIYNNCLPHIGNFDNNGYTIEEMKMINETKKILNLPKLKVSATCVRIPIQYSHSIAIDIKLKKKFKLADIFNLFTNLKDIVLLDDIKNNIYPLATIATGTDKIYVGRIRKDLFDKKRLHLFCVSDNIRKGAATNAIQILEYMEGKEF